MAYSVTYQSIVNNNIRNLYSGISTNIQPRTPTICPIKTPMKLLHEQQKLSSDRLNGTLYEYSREYKVRLPKAPAFRTLSQEEVHEIVHRLYQHNFRWRKAGKLGERPEGSPVSNKSVSSKSPSSEKSYSQSHLEAITNRVSKATVASDIRVKLRKNENTPLSELITCLRVQKPVHMRYKLRNNKIPKLPRLTFIDEKLISVDERQNRAETNVD